MKAGIKSKFVISNLVIPFLHLSLVLLIVVGKSSVGAALNFNNETEISDDSISNEELKEYVDRLLADPDENKYDIVPGISIEKVTTTTTAAAVTAAAPIMSGPRIEKKIQNSTEEEKVDNLQEYFDRKLQEFSQTHVVAVNIPQTARFFTFDAGKSSFITGFGMGFLAFALKKLLLPVFIGAQLVKSVLIAMFLPTILGSVGKLLGKGLSTFSGVSGASAGLNNHQHNHVEDFEFKDTDPYNNNNNNDLQDVSMDGDSAAAAGGNSLSVNAGDLDNAAGLNAGQPQANNRFGLGNQRISYLAGHLNNLPVHNDNYYMRRPAIKKTDYKVFHKIPSSSMLLTSYDPFYSPLLSRLDAVFQKLGLGNDKSPQTERCRERLVCMMYANPAKYAPYSNLVSAQLSRELNELKKPSSDNPDILRFFRYMKAAKDGQDGEECLAHGGCAALAIDQPSPALLTTFNDINKLVQARKLQ